LTETATDANLRHLSPIVQFYQLAAPDKGRMSKSSNVSPDWCLHHRSDETNERNQAEVSGRSLMKIYVENGQPSNTASHFSEVKINEFSPEYKDTRC